MALAQLGRCRHCATAADPRRRQHRPAQPRKRQGWWRTARQATHYGGRWHRRKLEKEGWAKGRLVAHAPLADRRDASVEMCMIVITNGRPPGAVRSDVGVKPPLMGWGRSLAFHPINPDPIGPHGGRQGPKQNSSWIHDIVHEIMDVRGWTSVSVTQNPP